MTTAELAQAILKTRHGQCTDPSSCSGIASMIYRDLVAWVVRGRELPATTYAYQEATTYVQHHAGSERN